MQATVVKNDTGNMDMIVKRVSVPIGLEELMEGLTKEVLLKKPKDLYIFASDYFSRLVTLREHSSHKAYTIRTMQSVTHLRTPDATEKKKVPLSRPSKHLTRQTSTQSKTPVQPKVSQVRKGIQRNEDRKAKEKATKEAVKLPLRRDRSKESTPSVESTPREKRQRSSSRQMKSSVGDSKSSTERIKPLKIENRTKIEKKTAPKPPTIRSRSELKNNALKDLTKTTTKIASQPLDSDIWAATTNVQEVTKLIDEKKADVAEDSEETGADKEKQIPETKNIETEKRKSPEGKEDIECPSSEDRSDTIEIINVDRKDASATLRSESAAETVKPEETDVRSGSTDDDLSVQVEKGKSSEDIEQKSDEKDDNSIDSCVKSGKEELNKLVSTDDKQEVDKELQRRDIDNASIAENKIINKLHEANNKTPSCTDDTTTEMAQRVPDDALDLEVKTTESGNNNESENKAEGIDGQLNNTAEEIMKTAQNDEIIIIPHGGDEKKKKTREHHHIDTVELVSKDSTSDNKDLVSKKDLIKEDGDKSKESDDNVMSVDSILSQGSTASINKDASPKEDLTANKDNEEKKSDHDSDLERNKLSLVNKGSKDSNDSSREDPGFKKDSVVKDKLIDETEHKDGIALDGSYEGHKKNNEAPDDNTKKEAEAKNNNIEKISSAGDKSNKKPVNINKDKSSITDEAQSSGEHIEQVGSQIEDNSTELESTEEKHDIIVDTQHNNDILEQKLDDCNSSLKAEEKGSFPQITPKNTLSKQKGDEMNKPETHQESSTKDGKDNDKKDVQIKMEEMGQSDDVLTISILEKSDSSHDDQDKSDEYVKEEPESKKDVGKQVSSENIESGEKRQFFPTNEELVSKERDKIEDHINKYKLENIVTKEQENKMELSKATDDDVKESGKIMPDVISIGDHINKVKSDVTKKQTKAEVKTLSLLTDSNGDNNIITNIASVDDHIDKPMPEEKYDKDEEEIKNITLLTETDSKVHSTDSDLTKKIINYDMADAKTGRVHTPVKTLLNSFLASEKQHVFKTIAMGAVQNFVKTVGNEEKIKTNASEDLKERSIKDEPCEANNKTESESILKHTSKSIYVKSEVPATKKEDSLILNSSKDSSEASNSLKLINKEVDSSDGNTNTQNVITDSEEDKPSKTGYRKRRSITIDETNGTESQEVSLQQASTNGICDLPSSETVVDAPSITDIAVEPETSKNSESTSISRTNSHMDKDQNVEIQTLQSVSSEENRLESGSSSFSGDKSLDNAQKEIGSSSSNIPSLISSQDRKIDSAKEEKERKDTLEQPLTDSVDAKIEISNLDSIEGKGISKENTFIKGDNKNISEVSGASKRADTEKVASVIEAVKNIYDANSITDKSSAGAAKEFVNAFLQNEQQHVFRNADVGKNLESNNMIDTKVDDEKDKRVMSNKKTKSKLAFGSKQDKRQLPANLLNNENEVSNVDNAKMRRAKSVGIIKIGEHESKSKIPTPVRRSAGRRPLVRQLDADSKELEEKLNFKRSSSDSSKENSNTARDFKEIKLTKDGALITKTILKGVEGAEKHIELIDEHLNRSVENKIEQNEAKLSSKEDSRSTEADNFEKDGKQKINQSKVENDEMEIDSLEIINDDKKQHDAATKIQKNWRGFHARNRLGQSKVDESDISPSNPPEDEGARTQSHLEVDKSENDTQKSVELIQNEVNLNKSDGSKANKIGNESVEFTGSKKSTVSDDSSQKEDVEKQINSSRINENIATEKDGVQSTVDHKSIEERPHVDSNKNKDMRSQIVSMHNGKVSKINKDAGSGDIKSGIKESSLEPERNSDENKKDDSCTTLHSGKHVESNSRESYELLESKKAGLKEVTVPDQANKIEQKPIAADYDGNVEKHIEPSLGKEDGGYENKGKNMVKQDDNSVPKNGEVLEGNQSKSLEKFDELKQNPIDLKQNEIAEHVTDQVQTSAGLDENKIDLIEANLPTSTPQAVESDANNAIVSEQGSQHEIQNKRKFETSQSKSSVDKSDVETDKMDENKDVYANILIQHLKNDKNEEDSVKTNRDANFPELIESNMNSGSEEHSSDQTDDSNSTDRVQEEHVLTNKVEKCDSQNKSGEDGSNNVIQKSHENDGNIVEEQHVETRPVEDYEYVNKSANVENLSGEERRKRVSEKKHNRKPDENLVMIQKEKHIESKLSEEEEKSIEKDQFETVDKSESNKNKKVESINEEDRSNRVSENKDNEIDAKIEKEEYIEHRQGEEEEKSANANIDKLSGKDERNIVPEHKDNGKSDEKGKHIEPRQVKEEEKPIKSDEEEGSNRVSENKDTDQKTTAEHIEFEPSQEREIYIENDQIKTVDNFEINKNASVDKLIGIDDRNKVCENKNNGKSDNCNESTGKEEQIEAKPSGEAKKSTENDQIKSSEELEINKSTNVVANEISKKQQEFNSRVPERYTEVKSDTDQNQDTQQLTETSQKGDATVASTVNQETVKVFESDQNKVIHSEKRSGENMEEYIESSRSTLIGNAPNKGVAEQADVNQSKKSEHIIGEETEGIGETNKVTGNEIKIKPIGTSQTEREKNLRKTKQSPEEAAVKIQSAWKGFVARKLMKSSRSEDQNLKNAHEQAIIKVQAIVRGFLDRMRIEKLKSADPKVKKSDKESTLIETDLNNSKNTNSTQNMLEPNANREEFEKNVLSSKGEEVADKGPIQSKSIKSDTGSTEFVNGSVKPPLEGEQTEINHHKGEMDVDDAVTKSNKSETNKQQILATEVIKAQGVTENKSECSTGSFNSINKGNTSPRDKNANQTSEVDKAPMAAGKILQSVAESVGIKEAADNNVHNNKNDHTNNFLADDNRPKRETNETVQTKDENIVKVTDEKYQSAENAGLDSSPTRRLNIPLGNIKSTVGRPEIKRRPESVNSQSNDLIIKGGSGSEIGAISDPAKDTQESDFNKNNNGTVSNKIDVRRSNTVEEPVCIKKSISHLGEDFNNLPDEHHAVTTDRKDDNNNSNKEETQLEKDVRSAVHNIMSNDSTNGKHLTPLEAEVSHAVKQIMKSHDNNEKTNQEQENIISNVDNTRSIDTILKQLPEVPRHEVPKAIVKKNSISNLEQHVEQFESQKANEEDNVKDGNGHTFDSSKSSVARPTSSKPLTTANIYLANVSTSGCSTSLDAPDDRSSVGSVDSVVTVIMKPKQDATDTGAEVTEYGPPQDNAKVQNKRLTSKALSTSALEDHVELIDQVQNSLLDQLSGKAVDSAKKFDIEELRKELHDAASLYKSEDDSSSIVGQDPEVMQYLYDFEPEDDHTYDSRMVRTPLRDLPDIAEETESKEEDTHTPDKRAQHFCGTSKLNSLAQASNSAAELTTSQSKKVEDHQTVLHTSNSIVIPVTDLSSEVLQSGASRVHSIADLGRLKHTSEFHDTVVVPLHNGAEPNDEDAPPERRVETSQANTMDSGNQTSIQQPPAGVEAVTSRRRPQDGVDVVKAQASLKDTSSAKLESGGSFTHQSPPQSPRTAEQAMESENNNNKRNNAINQSVTADGKNMEAAAATKIQAGFRGYQVRKQLKAKNTSLDQKRQLRKRSSRENMKDPELEEKSAVKIQAGVRGFLVRRRQKKQVNSSASA